MHTSVCQYPYLSNQYIFHRIIEFKLLIFFLSFFLSFYFLFYFFFDNIVCLDFFFFLKTLEDWKQIVEMKFIPNTDDFFSKCTW